MRQPIKFYVDEHVATAVVKGLRQRGADVLTVLEAGLRGASDAEHLTLAQTDGRVLFTQNCEGVRHHLSERPVGRCAQMVPDPMA
jgi:predicted nuclease of predicted toxin-antitoxin system